MDSLPKILILHWLKLWILNFLVCFIFFSSIIFLFSISENLEKYSSFIAENPFRLFLNLILPFLSTITPICCFAGTVFTYFLFEKNLEWTSLQTCSISPLWINLSILLLSLIVSSLILNWASDASIPITSDSETDSLVIKKQNKYTWYFQAFDSVKMKGKNLQIYLNDENGHDVLRLRCSEAVWDESDGWTFYNGLYLSFLTDKGLPVPNEVNQTIQWLPFDAQRLNDYDKSSKTPQLKKEFLELSLKEFNENPIPHILIGKDPRNLARHELRRVINEYPNSESFLIAPFKFEYAKANIFLFSGLFSTVAALALVARRDFPSTGNIISFILTGLVALYILKRFFDVIGESGMLNEWICTIVPIFTSLFLAYSVIFRKNRIF